MSTCTSRLQRRGSRADRPNALRRLEYDAACRRPQPAESVQDARGAAGWRCSSASSTSPRACGTCPTRPSRCSSRTRASAGRSRRLLRGRHHPVADQAGVRPALGFRAALRVAPEELSRPDVGAGLGPAFLAAAVGTSEYWPLLVLFTLMALGLAFTDVLTDALMVENGRAHGLTGAFQAVQWAAIYTASILVGLVGGYLAAAAQSGRRLPARRVLSARLADHGQPPSCAEKRARGIGPRSCSDSTAVRKALRAREVWLVAGFIFFFTFSPSFGPAFLYYQTDMLRFSQQFIGSWNALQSFGSVLGALYLRAAVTPLAAAAPINLSIGLSARRDDHLPALSGAVVGRGDRLHLRLDLHGDDAGPAGSGRPGRVRATSRGRSSRCSCRSTTPASRARRWTGGRLYDSVGFERLVLISTAATLLTFILVPFVHVDRIEVASAAAADARRPHTWPLTIHELAATALQLITTIRSRGRTPDGLSAGGGAARAADSCAAAVKIPRVMSARLAARARRRSRPRSAWAARCRARPHGPVDQVAGQRRGRLRAASSRARAISASTPPARRATSRGHLGVRRGLQVRGDAVPPAAVEPPDIADDVVGLVVDRLEIGAIGQVGGGRTSRQDRVERGPGVHQRERLALERLEPLRGVAERLAHARGADDRHAVAGDQELGPSAPHRAQRRRPLGGVALDLLRVAGVGRDPDEEIAGEEDAPLGPPHPGGSSVSPRAWCSSSVTPPASRGQRLIVDDVGVVVVRRPGGAMPNWRALMSPL